MTEELPKELMDFSKKVEERDPDSVASRLESIENLLATLPERIREALTEG